MNLKNKKITVFGLGVSGQSAAEFLLREKAELSLINQGDPKTWSLSSQLQQKQSLGEFKTYDQNHSNAQCALLESELIILSPGIPREHPLLVEPLKQKIPIWNDLELATHFCKDIPIIGITGTNGKTTTVSLLAMALEKAGKKIFLGGNIGRPLCDWCLTKDPVDFIILELSSFQLESMPSFHPKIACILNLSENHGERYSSTEDYFKAKFNILNNLKKGDIFLKGENISLSKNADREFKIIHFDENKYIDEIPDGEYLLKGTHNKKNLWFITQIFHALNIPLKALSEAMATFNGIPHRLELIKETSSMLIFNDSKSTNWNASLSAVESLIGSEFPILLICGGKRRGKHDELSEKQIHFLNKSCMKIMAFGESAGPIKKQLPKIEIFQNLDLLFKDLIKDEQKKIILFSPGFPSFDLYENYMERGKAFKDLCQNYFN